jgi:hypothetical protein
MVTMPPAATVIRPTWAAAVQIEESWVYVSVPQALPVGPPAGHRYEWREPITPGRAQLCAVALVLQVASVAPHTPALQVSPAAHGLAHPPQWAPSVMVSTHAVPQSVRPGAQVQSEAMQTSGATQAIPHPPQCMLLLRVSMQLPPHSMSPAPPQTPAHGVVPAGQSGATTANEHE